MTAIKVLLPISVGDFADRLSIVEIKKARILNPGKFQEIEELLNTMREVQKEHTTNSSMFPLDLYESLKDINMILWDVEDGLRRLEKQKKFNKLFTTLARLVYMLNDQRAAIKREIDEATSSSLGEVKSYTEY